MKDGPFCDTLKEREYLTPSGGLLMAAGIYLYLHELWLDGIAQGKMDALEDWRLVLEYWKAHGKDLRYLEIPPELADKLGVPKDVTVTKREEAMADNTSEYEGSGSKEPKWKKRKEFDGKSCGYQGCNRAADGYVQGTRSTKEGKSGALWFGPACKQCVRDWHQTLEPLTLAKLAEQRHGASDLALVLDLEVGEVLKRLDAAGIDERGRKLAIDTIVVIRGGDPKDAPSAEDVSVEESQTFTIAVVVPFASILSKRTEAEATLAALANFHICDQSQMDYASTYLARVKGLYNEIEAEKKAISGPFKAQVTKIQKHFKPALELLSEVERTLKQKIQEGYQRAQAAQQAAFQGAERALATGDLQGAALASQQAVAADVTLSSGVQVRKTIKFRIVNPAAVPTWAWSPDPEKIQAAIDAGWREIPGVEIYEDTTIASRAVAP